MSKRKDYTGEKIGLLRVLSKTDKKAGSCGKLYNSACECGSIKEVSSNTLRRAVRVGYAISCGKCKGATRMNNNPKEAAFNALYSRYLGGAKTRGLKFELSKDDVRKITSKICSYCGVAPSQTSYTATKNAAYTYNGMDRIDSSKG